MQQDNCPNCEGILRLIETDVKDKFKIYDVWQCDTCQYEDKVIKEWRLIN